MKFTTEKSEFMKALVVCSRSSVTRSSLPILSNILIRATKNNVELISTSLETAVKAVIACKVQGEGETTVLGRALVEFILQLEESEVTFEKLGEEVLVTCGGSSARFSTIAPEEFPAIPRIEGGKHLSLDSAEFSKNVSRVFFCAAQDESRPILAGILFEGSKDSLSIVATDGFRLGRVRFEMKKGELVGLKFVIPAKTIAEIPKIVSEIVGDKEGEKIELIVSDNLTQAMFKMKGVEYTTRLIEGAYPQWEKLIPANFATKVDLKKDDLVRAVKIASIFAKDAGNIVKFKIGNDGKHGNLTVSSNTAQIGSSDSKVETTLSGPGGEIAFNFRYLLEALGSIDTGEVVFEMNESLNPGRIVPSGEEDFFHIIMPVRLQS